MNIIITGAAGFLGSHLADYYLAQGDKVYGLDNLSTGRKENIAHILANPNFVFMECDITKPLDSSLLAVDCQLILNFACPASPPKYQAMAQETLDVCSLGVRNMIQLSRKNKARLIQASTSEIYGDPLVSPQPESYWGNANTYGPRCMYDEGKRYSEALLWISQNSNEDKLNAGIVRIFNTYGPRMAPDDGRVVSTFIVEALKNSPLTMHGDGTQSRSFCYVSDLIDGIAKLAESNEQEPVNIGSPNEFTMNELAEKILDLTQSKSTINRVERPVDDPSQRQPDITRAKTILGWEPKVDLKEGLEKTIEYFRNHA